jgi:hypothetical protein
LPVEVLSAISLRDYGFDPIDVEQAIVLGFPPAASPLRYGAIVRFTKAVAREKLLPSLFKTAERGKIVGHDVWRVDAPLLPSLCVIDDRTLLLAPMSELKSMLEAKDVGGPLQNRLKKAHVSHHLTTVFSYDAVREQLKARLEAVPELPPPLADLVKLIDHVSAQELRVDLGLELRTEVVLYARGADSVPEIERLVKSATKVRQGAGPGDDESRFQVGRRRPRAGGHGPLLAAARHAALRLDQDRPPRQRADGQRHRHRRDERHRRGGGPAVAGRTGHARSGPASPVRE